MNSALKRRILQKMTALRSLPRSLAPLLCRPSKRRNQIIGNELAKKSWHGPCCCC